MANPFSINVVTSAGASLIASATAANQIVITSALSGTTAASDAADLASKTESFYDGITGTISACSATDNLAHIITRFGNAGASNQVVKSVAIKGRLASQSDAQAVIIAAMSDADSQIYFPSNASPNQITRIKFQFAVQADSTVYATFADGATIADLERFVSMYQAGDPTTGEAQTILGKKLFTDDASFGGDVDITYDMTTMGKATFFSQIEAQDDVDVSGTLDAGSITTNAITTRNNGGDDLTITCGDLKTTGITLSGSLDVGADSIFRDYVEIQGTLDVTAITGLAPLEDTEIKVPVGGLVTAWIPRPNSLVLESHAGQSITVSASSIKECMWDSSTSAYTEGSAYIQAGTYRLLNAISLGSTEKGPALLQRVS